MIIFINTFISYLLLFLIFVAIMVAAVICGKKLRESKDIKDAATNEAVSGKEEE